MFKIEEVRDLAREAVAELDPACLDGHDAARLAEAAAEGAKLLDAATAMLAKRAADTNAWRRTSHAATPDQWLAEATGRTEGAAREALNTAQRLEWLPATAEQLRSGALSLTQAAQVSAAAIVDPGAEEHLLRTAKRSGMRELRAERERVIAAATDETEAHERARRDRHLRTWTQGFATHGSFSGPTTDVARILSALEPLTTTRFDDARRAGERESRDAYRFDALVTLSEGTPSTTARPAPHAVRVRVDLPALLRGRSASGEACKIRGCDGDRMLERHHTPPFEESHRTTYRELGNLCPKHHDLVTHRGYATSANHDGTWDLHAPAHAPPDEAAA